MTEEAQNAENNPVLWEDKDFGEAKILVVGCGGAGNNSVNRLHRLGIHGAETLSINTDKLHLYHVNSDKKVLIGKNLTRGLGAGGRPDIAREAAELARGTLEEMFVGADLVFDVVGNQLAQAVELVRRGGRVVPFGVQAQAICSLPQSHITMKEVTVIGSWLANASFPIAVSLLEDDSVSRDLSKLVTHRIGLREIWEGIELLRKGQAIKVVVDPTR